MIKRQYVVATLLVNITAELMESRFNISCGGLFDWKSMWGDVTPFVCCARSATPTFLPNLSPNLNACIVKKLKWIRCLAGGRVSRKME